MNKPTISFPGAIQWLLSRVAIIYVIVFIFCLTCVDLKMLDKRIKIRHLNDAIPDFSTLINFSNAPHAQQAVDWKPYQIYFGLILRYMPDDLVTRQFLAYVDFNAGQGQKAIDLYKGAEVLNGQELFWSDYNLGVIYHQQANWPMAAQYLFKAISSNPQLMVILMQNSTVYRQISLNPYFKYSLKDEYNEALSRVHILLLSSLQHMKLYDKMIAIANLGISNQDLHYKDAYYYYAGIAFFEAGQVDKAFALFQKSLSLEKDNPEVYFYMANIYQKAGQANQARELMKIAYALYQKNDPRFPYDKQEELRFF